MKPIFSLLRINILITFLSVSCILLQIMPYDCTAEDIKMSLNSKTTKLWTTVVVFETKNIEMVKSRLDRLNLPFYGIYTADDGNINRNESLCFLFVPQNSDIQYVENIITVLSYYIFDGYIKSFDRGFIIESKTKNIGNLPQNQKESEKQKEHFKKEFMKYGLYLIATGDCKPEYLLLESSQNCKYKTLYDLHPICKEIFDKVFKKDYEIRRVQPIKRLYYSSNIK